MSELLRIYQFRDRERICCYDVSVTQCYALSALTTRGPMPLNRLAADLYLDKSTASRAVDALEKKGYVRRKVDPGDRRALRLEVTRQGRILFTRIEKDLVAEMKTMIHDFEPDIRKAATLLVARLARAATKRFSRCEDNTGTR